jgi:hypothetical protein
MAKTKISEYDSTAGNNTDINSINIDEGCSPSGINNAIRALMSHLKNWQGGTSGDALPVASGGTGSTTAGAARTALSAAASGANSDITSLTGLTTPLTTAQGGTGSNATTYCGLTTNVTGTLPVGNGGTGLTTFTAGTTYVAPATATTFTALQTFSGSTSVLAAKFANSAEVVTVSATAATGTINYDVTTQAILYYTSNASANFTVNFRASSGTTLNTAMAIGDSVTVVFMVTNGATAFYNNAVTVDGTSVTPKYQNGSAWSSGSVSAIDAYSYTIIKTASATFTVLASKTKFA